MQRLTQLQWRYASADWVIFSERSDGMLKHVFVREEDILDLVGARRVGNTEQLTKLKQLTTEREKMAMESSEDKYVLCLRNSETGTNFEKVLELFVPNKVLNHHHKD